jgi:hypothetical protein
VVTDKGEFMSNYSGNFRIMDAGGMTQSMTGVRYEEDGKPIVGVVQSVNTVSKLEIYVTNACVILSPDWESWSQSNLPPTGLLCVHTEDYGLGEADNVLADAERLRGKVLSEMRGGGSVEVEVPTDPAPTVQQNTAPLIDSADKNQDGVVTPKERKQHLKGN